MVLSKGRWSLALMVFVCEKFWVKVMVFEALLMR